MVILIVYLITFNVRVTIFIIFVVVLVILYITASIHFWGLTLNNITAMNLLFALGISIDYAVHVSHKYLIIRTTAAQKTNAEKRDYKARMAISQMGSSVFHGAFSTLITVCILGMGQMYIFNAIFKTWLTMVIFGMLNGTILQPIILSYLGPINDEKDHGE